jgi:hypothetical protein
MVELLDCLQLLQPANAELPQHGQREAWRRRNGRLTRMLSGRYLQAAALRRAKHLRQIVLQRYG